jgi:diacylglycerol O-acyltransferase
VSTGCLLLGNPRPVMALSGSGMDPAEGFCGRLEVLVSDRLSVLDASFLYLESATTPMHVGSVMVFEARTGVDHVRLVRHVQARIAFVPRYRQRLRVVPGRLANPVWVDDERFDINYHVRRSALPRPGTRQQLGELVARLQSRPLDRLRPLWELIFVEGLENGCFAVVTKVHQALVDGTHAVDLGQVVLDATEEPFDPPAHLWRPAPEPSPVELVVGAVADSVRRPQQAVERLRSGVGDVRTTVGKALELLGGVAARTAARPTPRSPLNPDIGEHRRFVMVTTNLEDYRLVRARSAAGPRRPTSSLGQPGQVVSITDVVLATLAGGLRAWLLTRGEPVRPSSMVRVLVPLSVRAGARDDAGRVSGDPERASSGSGAENLVDEGASEPVTGSLPGVAVGPAAGSPAGAIGSDLTWLLVDLPTGEPSPLMRLHQVAYQTRAHREGGRGVEARQLAGIAGFAPPTLHSLGARVASGLSRHLFNLVVTNVPGPQLPLYLSGARMLAAYPVIPLARGQALSIGLTSYDGGVYYGLYTDREAMPDLEVLAQCVVDALAEMVEAAR